MPKYVVYCFIKEKQKYFISLDILYYIIKVPHMNKAVPTKCKQIQSSNSTHIFFGLK